jgi:Papain family cysteine protease
MHALTPYKRHIIVAFLLSIATFAHAQRGTGLAFDDAAYQKDKRQPRFSGAKFNGIPPSVSLRKYCPTAGDQRATNACVGWSVGYGALTICRAIQTGNVQISQNQAHSAAFVYNQIKQGDDCYAGASLSKAFDFISTTGNCTVQTFKNNPKDCNEKPNAKATTEATNFRIKDYATLFSPTDSDTVKWLKTKQQIAAQNPVIIGLLIDSIFQISTKFEQNTWKIDTNSLNLGKNSGHSMIVVGYDDSLKAFELMNSWGSNWGDNGFVWVSYKDFSKVVKYGFVMTLDEKFSLRNGKPVPMTTTELLTSSAEPYVSLSGEFVYQNIASVKDKPDGTLAIEYAQARATYNAQRQVYETNNKWRVNDMFQLVAKRVPKGKYVYIFSQDAVGKVDIHYPLNTNDFSHFMPSPDAEIILPSEDDALQLSKRGEDIICIFYADQAIKDFSTRFEKFKKEQGSFSQKLNKIFGDVLIKNKDVSFAPFEMRFNSLTKKSQGSVVALLLSVIAE